MITSLQNSFMSFLGQVKSRSVYSIQRQKITRFIALAALTALGAAYFIYKRMNRNITPILNPELQGQLNGKITYNSKIILNVEGVNLQLDQKGYLNGHAKVTLSDASYEGEFKQSLFKEGVFKGSISNRKYVIHVKDSKFTKAQEILGDGTVLEKSSIDCTKLRLRAIRNSDFLFNRLRVSTSKYKFEGVFKGQLKYGSQTHYADLKDLKFDERQNLSGQGKITVEGNIYEGIFQNGRLKEGHLKGTVNQKEVEARISKEGVILTPKIDKDKIGKTTNIAVVKLLGRPFNS